MNILAIETSCDETSVAIVENGKIIKSNIISSQIKRHAKYGGVVPELASRLHAESIHHVIEVAYIESGMTPSDINAIAVTIGPGLEGALLVGVGVAKAIAALLEVPLIEVNHLHGHMYTGFLLEKAVQFPFVALLVSGGHTSLVYVEDHAIFKELGCTRDDACGEAFDKVAKALGLAYPGGPIIENLAKEGCETAFSFPRAMLKQGLEFSFSGLKTALIQTIQSFETEMLPVADICASFQACVGDILTHKARLACKKMECSTVLFTGGVSANRYLTERLKSMAKQNHITCIVPPPVLCTDNAAMIGAAAYYQASYIESGSGQVSPSLSIESFSCD